MSVRLRRVLVSVLIGLALLAGAVALPVHTWFDQQRDIASAKAELRRVQGANRVLSIKLKRLEDPAAIEQQAREQYGLAKPGEESYIVTPAPDLTVNLPAVWPFDRLQESVARAAARQ